MKITSVDSANNLFLIQDFYQQSLIDAISKHDCNTYAYENLLVEGKYTRRNILQGQKYITQLHSQSMQNIKEIGKFLNKNLKLQSYNVWYDLPGYSMTAHLDNVSHVKIGMQVYLTNSNQSLGTYFYNNSNIRYFFPYTANTGYMMINSVEQYHAAPVVVPNNTTRLSVYHRISIA